MRGWINLGRFAHGLLDGTTNALKDAPMEYKFLLSNTLAAMWYVTFGVSTAELVFIGHTFLIASVFVTWFVFKSGQKDGTTVPANRVRWDLGQEG